MGLERKTLLELLGDFEKLDQRVFAEAENYLTIKKQGTLLHQGIGFTYVVMDKNGDIILGIDDVYTPWENKTAELKDFLITLNATTDDVLGEVKVCFSIDDENIHSSITGLAVNEEDDLIFEIDFSDSGFERKLDKWMQDLS